MAVTATMLAQYTTHRLITKVLVDNIVIFEKNHIISYFEGCNRDQIIFFKCLIYMVEYGFSFDDAHTIFFDEKEVGIQDMENLLDDGDYHAWDSLCVSISDGFELMKECENLIHDITR
ncbi:hypothetical protein [Listeria newyorkensis]|uniref:Uncharacterized protein n=1 Tax=Listeria newyorkensis TaxID=1497681 RepID=A0A841YVQ4_9LIST|nr:hypothetical protein [Listeria newyorkensis]MBC1457891.1 hypothetical protein [Listeria newyorkensis]